MPLVPELVPLMEASNAPGLPKMHEVGPVAAREMAKATVLPVAEPIEVGAVEDRRIPGPGGDLPVRIYTPPGSGPFGALVYYHGSGFVIFDLDSHDNECRGLCRGAGVVVVSVDYRLAPEHKYPAAADDAIAAVEWVAANATALGVDPARIAVGGDSAGGNLAAVAAQDARDRGGPALAFQLLIYPVTDCRADHPSMEENGEGYGLTEAQMKWFIEMYVREEADKLAARCSPLLADSLASLPPALVQTCEFDVLRDEGEDYADRLAKDGVDVTCTRYDGLVHGAFQMRALVPPAAAMMDEAVAALKAAIG